MNEVATALTILIVALVAWFFLHFGGWWAIAAFIATVVHAEEAELALDDGDTDP